jgi:hypothetical protein
MSLVRLLKLAAIAIALTAIGMAYLVDGEVAEPEPTKLEKFDWDAWTEEQLNRDRREKDSPTLPEKELTVP